MSPGLGKHHRADGPSTDMLRDLALRFCILLWICVEAVLHQEGREEERGGWIRGGGGGGRLLRCKSSQAHGVVGPYVLWVGGSLVKAGYQI